MVDFKSIVARCTAQFDPASVHSFKRAIVLALKHHVSVDKRVLNFLYVTYVFANHFVWDDQFDFSDDEEGNPDCFIDKEGFWSCHFRVSSYDWSDFYLDFFEGGRVLIYLNPLYPDKDTSPAGAPVLMFETLYFSLNDPDWAPTVCTFFNQHMRVGYGNDEPTWVNNKDRLLLAELMEDTEGMLAYLSGAYIFGVDIEEKDDYLIHS